MDISKHTDAIRNEVENLLPKSFTISRVMKQVIFRICFVMFERGYILAKMESKEKAK